MTIECSPRNPGSQITTSATACSEHSGLGLAAKFCFSLAFSSEVGEKGGGETNYTLSTIPATSNLCEDLFFHYKVSLLLACL